MKKMKTNKQRNITQTYPHLKQTPAAAAAAAAATAAAATAAAAVQLTTA